MAAECVFEIDNISHYPQSIQLLEYVVPFYTNGSNTVGTLTVVDETRVRISIQSIEWKPFTHSVERMLSDEQVSQFLMAILTREDSQINGVWLVNEIGNDGRSYYLYRMQEGKVVVWMPVHLKAHPNPTEIR